jgi:hypothetical protein
MELKASLPSSQEAPTGPYPVPGQSSPYNQSNLSKVDFNIITRLRLCLPSGVFLKNILCAFLFFPYILYALSTSCFLTSSF